MAAISKDDRRKKNMSRGLHQYIHRNNKTLPVPVTNVIGPIRTRVSRRFCTAQKPWPVMHLSDWVTMGFNKPEFQGFFFLGGKRLNELKNVENQLSTFWDRYKYIDCNLPACPQRTLPIFLHGDEGRGLTKRPLLILAFQPIIGWGGEHHVNTIKYP